MADLSAVRNKGALTLNDLADLEEKFNTRLDSLDTTRFTVLRFIMWLVIRREEPGVTEHVVGERYNLETLQNDALAVLRRSGLLPQVEEGGPVEPAEALKEGKALGE
jgi:hypothetical protein